MTDDPNKINNNGEKSLIFSIIGIMLISMPYLGIIFSIIGLVFAIKQRRIHRSGYDSAGLIIGGIGILFNIIMLISVLGIFSNIKQETTAPSLKNNAIPEEVLSAYIYYLNYSNFEGLLLSIKERKKLSSEWLYDSLSLDEEYYKERLDLNNELRRICIDIKELGGNISCTQTINDSEDISRQVDVISFNTIDKNQNQTKIEVIFSSTLNYSGNITTQEYDIVYILKKTDEQYRVINYLEKGRLGSEIYDLQIRKQDNIRELNTMRNIVNKSKRLVELEKSYYTKKTEENVVTIGQRFEELQNNNLERFSKRLDEFHEKHKKDPDFVQLYTKIERDYRYEPTDYLAYYFMYKVDIKKNNNEWTWISLDKIWEYEAYKSEWYIYLCIFDENGVIHPYRGTGDHENRIDIDLEFPFNAKGIAIVYHSPNEYGESGRFFGHDMFFSNCKSYLQSIQEDNRYYFLEFKTPPINQTFIETFETYEEELCHNYINFGKENEFYTSEKGNYTKKTCCEIWLEKYPDYGETSTCKKY